MILHGDCLEKLKELKPNSIDSLVTDPPAGISFMGKGWDSDKGGRHMWIRWMTEVMLECKRILKPGAHGLVWALPRTSHWTAMALEDAGFEIRDCVYHLFGSGFPKSLDVSKAMDKMAGVKREIIGRKADPRYLSPATETSGSPMGHCAPRKNSKINYERAGFVTAPVTDVAKQWDGWGTALKPAVECWWLVRKPLSEKTVAANVLRWGCGALNIDGSRISFKSEEDRQKTMASNRHEEWGSGPRDTTQCFGADNRPHKTYVANARFPSHLVLSCDCPGAEHGQMCAVHLLDEQSLVGGMHSAGKARANHRDTPGDGKGLFPMHGVGGHRLGDAGGASRFFYCAKVSASERNAGLERMEAKLRANSNKMMGESGAMKTGSGNERTTLFKNHHPTVKPQKLMRYLCRLITPPNGTILDPFMGSGSTGLAAQSDGFEFIGIEREQEYVEIAQKRIESFA